MITLAQTLIPLAFVVAVQSDTTPSLNAILAAFEARDTEFFGARSVHLKFRWSETDHLQLNEDQEQKLLGLIKESRFSEIPQRFPLQRVMRTPGYDYEFAQRNSRLFLKVVNPLDGKFGTIGRRSAFDGTFGVEISEDIHATITSSPSPYTWQFFEYGFLLHLDVYKHVDGLQIDQLPLGIRQLGLPSDMRENSSAYHIRGMQKVGDADCLLLDRDDTHRFWLDRERNYAIRRVDIFAANGTFSSASQRYSALMSDLTEVRPSLWMPRKITQEIFEDAKSNQAVLAVRRILTVDLLEFDTLDDEFFKLALPTNIIVHDNVRNIEYRNQKSGIPFDQAIAYARERIDRPGSVGRWRILALVVGNLTILVVFIWNYVIRRRSRIE